MLRIRSVKHLARANPMFQWNFLMKWDLDFNVFINSLPRIQWDLNTWSFSLFELPGNVSRVAAFLILYLAHSVTTWSNPKATSPSAKKIVVISELMFVAREDLISL